MTTLAVLLLVAATGVGALAYRDYESNRASRDYQLAIITTEDLSASATDCDRSHRTPGRARGLLTPPKSSRSRALAFAEKQKSHTAAPSRARRPYGGVILISRASRRERTRSGFGNINGLL